MPHTVPNLIKLDSKFNRPIMPSAKTSRGIQSSRDRSGRLKVIDKKTAILPKQFVVYRMWYRFLQLALELEQKKVSIITKEKRVPLKKPKKDAWGHIRKSEVKSVAVKVKVNRTAYKEWSIDKVLETTFDDWWFGSKSIKSHRGLFYSEPSVMIKSKDEYVDEEHFAYFKIDKRKRVNDIVAELRTILSLENYDKKKGNLSKYTVYGTPNVDTLINRYNAFIEKVTTEKSDEDIFESGLFRRTSLKMRKDDTKKYKYKVEGENWGRMMRDLIFPAKITLLSVCDGYFVNNPTKKYV
jgi:hypothetical protein